MRVVHDALDTRSRQLFRGVLDGRSRSVYSGRVVVCPHAQKTDSGQASANLLLSAHAEADTRPQLEIHADNVTCNHGAATGAIDPDALFYLQSRGLDADAARRMIAYGFAAHILADLDEARLHRELLALLAARMQAGVNHGAATGAIDPDALFYLQSRGLDAAAARRMIAYGFAAHILAGLDDARLQRELLALLAARMQAPQEVLEWL